MLAALTAGLHMLTLVTVAAVPDHRCAVPGLDENGTVSFWNSKEVLAAIPNTKDGVLDSCHLMDPIMNISVKCNKWIYDNTYYQSSRAIEWDLVCDRRWMGAVAQTAYMLGVFTGAVVLGSMADKYGRKIILYISAVLQLVLGVGVAFVPEYYSFLVIRFLYGIFGSAGAYITGFVLSMEIVGPSKRTVIGVLFQAFFATGLMLVAFWGFFIKDRVVLQVIYGLHSLLLIGHWWTVDESPRWLWAQGQFHKAVAIVEKAMKQNGCTEELDVAYFVSKGKAKTAVHENDRASLADLVKTPNLRSRTFNIVLNWFANSLVYYGLSLNTGKLFGNPYLVLFIVGLVEYPSYIMIVLLMDRLGRRSLLSVLLLLGGLSCIIAVYIPQDTQAGSISATTVVMLGKFFVAGSFAIVYNYTAELFPTVVRNTALGIGSMGARLSGALTPLITLLDSFDKRLPSIIFGAIAVISGLLALLLPETLNQPMPQTLEDGEKFGQGDTALNACCKKRSRGQKYDLPLSYLD
ncbi:Organic cation transporter protein [Zootermopsis nevadensis]|uniref:Organic cation transporter protein n=2 Tax=Zootermopsis nevadensis TaxID=136037 RepID=A0A067RHW4_ZOONE|nr:Organic cation transporter protein [Zootermopsis nevadensis]